MTSINKQIVDTETFKQYQHEKLKFGKESYEVAIITSTEDELLCQVHMIFQFATRSKNIEEYYDVNSRMSLDQVDGKPEFVKEALMYAKAIEASVNRELLTN